MPRQATASGSAAATASSGANRGVGWIRRGPLAGRYPAAAAMVMFALIPYLALSAAIGPITPIIAHSLHMSIMRPGGPARSG